MTRTTDKAYSPSRELVAAVNSDIAWTATFSSQVSGFIEDGVRIAFEKVSTPAVSGQVPTISFLDTASGTPTRVTFLFIPTVMAAQSMPTPKPYPDQMYVAAPAVAKMGSLFVAALSIFSLIVTFSTGFSLVDPFACLIFLTGAATFYGMGAMAEGRGKGDRKSL